MSQLGKGVFNGMKMNAERRFSKKYYKKTLNLLKEYKDDVKLSHTPTPHLFIGNGGMLCGRRREEILSLFKLHGAVINLIMMPQKSYSFLSYKSSESATKAVSCLNSYVLDTNDSEPVAPLYLFYLQSLVNLSLVSPANNYPVEGKPDLIGGMVFEQSFISEEYEEELISYFKVQLEELRNMQGTLKHRSVKHFGFEFLYGSNNIDRSKPLEEKIPQICKPLVDKLLINKLISFIPDQLTVNQYEPGQGIPPHVDTHSAFEDGIVSLSLSHQVTMDFTHPHGNKVSMILPRRSLLIMKGESRYLWTHGITPRTHDIYYTEGDHGDGGCHGDSGCHSDSGCHGDGGCHSDVTHNGDSTSHGDSAGHGDEKGCHGEEKTYKCLSLKQRGVRISLTFRKILYEACVCMYKEQCDSQNMNDDQTEGLYVPGSKDEAVGLEGEHVYKVYEQIAEHFSDTRHTPWPRIKQFLCELEDGSLVADIGCGNGKYLGVNPRIKSLGSDRSSNLVTICVQRGFEALLSDCLYLPYRSNSFDASICIAVIHHLSTEERRLEALKELVRITCVNGLVLVYVWALEQEFEEIKSDVDGELQSMSTIETNEFTTTESTHSISESSSNVVPEITSRPRIEVSEGRNVFQQQDLLIPWHLKQDCEENSSEGKKEEKIFHRFYHVFKQGELGDLCRKVENVNVKEVYFDKGNWCAVLRKVT